MIEVARVMDPGALTIVEDAGRAGYAHLGVPRAGAFDPRSWRLANRLVGNRDDAAGLESLGGGLTLQMLTSQTIAVAGAVGTLFVDGRGHETNTVVHVHRGARVTLGRPRAGIRYYVALSGGVHAERVLGSVSYDSLGGLGPPPLRAGDLIRTSVARYAHPTIDHAVAEPVSNTFSVLPGPDAYDAAIDGLLAQVWDLDPQSDRIGIRLAGQPLPARSHSLPSKPMVLGAVQLPPNGLPIILGPDHPTTGGYPVIAVVTGASMCDVAQWSGGPRRFRRA